jgi:hypothetical protein
MTRAKKRLFLSFLAPPAGIINTNTADPYDPFDSFTRKITSHRLMRPPSSPTSNKPWLEQSYDDQDDYHESKYQKHFHPSVVDTSYVNEAFSTDYTCGTSDARQIIALGVVGSGEAKLEARQNASVFLRSPSV